MEGEKMNNINWPLRLKNPVTLVSLIVLVIDFVYNVLAMVGIIPVLSQPELLNGIAAFACLVLATGIITDPTTKGFFDSLAALGYEQPKDSFEEMMLMPDDSVLEEDETLDQTPEPDMEEEE